MVEISFGWLEKIVCYEVMKLALNMLTPNGGFSQRVTFMEYLIMSICMSTCITICWLVPSKC